MMSIEFVSKGNQVQGYVEALRIEPMTMDERMLWSELSVQGAIRESPGGWRVWSWGMVERVVYNEPFNSKLGDTIILDQRDEVIGWRER